MTAASAIYQAQEYTLAASLTLGCSRFQVGGSSPLIVAPEDRLVSSARGLPVLVCDVDDGPVDLILVIVVLCLS